MLRLRTMNLIASLALVAYNTVISVWPMVAMNAVVSVIDIYYIVRLTRSESSDTPAAADSSIQL
ncbi:hypothetical protein AB4Y94_00155 [Glaciibacter sp. 2TAF33]